MSFLTFKMERQVCMGNVQFSAFFPLNKVNSVLYFVLVQPPEAFVGLIQMIYIFILVNHTLSKTLGWQGTFTLIEGVCRKEGNFFIYCERFSGFALDVNPIALVFGLVLNPFTFLLFPNRYDLTFVLGTVIAIKNYFLLIKQ